MTILITRCDEKGEEHIMRRISGYPTPEAINEAKEYIKEIEKKIRPDFCFLYIEEPFIEKIKPL